MDTQSTRQNAASSPLTKLGIGCGMLFLLMLAVGLSLDWLMGYRGPRPPRLGPREALVATIGEDQWLVLQVQRLDFRRPTASPPVATRPHSLIVVRFDSRGVHEAGEHDGPPPYWSSLLGMEGAGADGRLYLSSGDPRFGSYRVWTWGGDAFVQVPELPDNSVEVSLIRESHLSLSPPRRPIEGTDFLIDFRGEQGEDVWLKWVQPGEEWEQHVITLDINHSAPK